MTDLHELYLDSFSAPFVKNAPVQMAMTYVEEYDIKVNNTILLIGEIKDLYLKDNLLQKDGFLNLSEANIAAINGLDGYSIPQLKTRFDYQRPKDLSKLKL